MGGRGVRFIENNEANYVSSKYICEAPLNAVDISSTAFILHFNFLSVSVPTISGDGEVNHSFTVPDVILNMIRRADKRTRRLLCSINRAEITRLGFFFHFLHKNSADIPFCETFFAAFHRKNWKKYLETLHCIPRCILIQSWIFALHFLCSAHIFIRTATAKQLQQIYV